MVTEVSQDSLDPDHSMRDQTPATCILSDSVPTFILWWSEREYLAAQFFFWLTQVYLIKMHGKELIVNWIFVF